MAILHLVRGSAFNDQNLSQCLSLANKEDAIIFIDDGVYNLAHSLLSKNENQHFSFFVIEHHFVARGLKNQSNNIKSITMNELVALALTYKQTITWQ